ncbi:iron ABC transporter permease [Tessaracoccus sp. MC1627]|uniref:FecCD family ABC transporter permease n=1 Tax=Tessaracoccus sp. MC1627 TaxID=2760312 RepID=UPI001602F3E2|nr:iron ABC transporter permease [Tessaracoccus sp. MC1627]MBB1511587.1 iron ABC transporter permease [Tessaracoccus sp. MC1627]
MSAASLLAATVRRRRLVLAGAVVVVVGLFLARALLGDYQIAAVDAVRILLGADLGPASFIFLETKLPIALVALASGMALGGSGAAFQSMLRNPLASPDVMGVTLGASAAAITSLVVFGLSGAQVTAAAFAGGLTVAVGIFALSGGAHSASNRIILIGLGLAFALQAVIHWVLIRGSVYQARDAMRWLGGSLSGVNWDGVGRIWAAVAVGLPLLLMLGRPLRLIEVGDDLAGGLGVRVSRVRLAVLLVVVLLTAAATSVAGPIAFVGLLAGPIARRLNAGRSSLPLAALVGAVVVLGADLLGDARWPWGPLPVGIITGLLGAPMLVALLLRSTSEEEIHG